MTTGTDTLATPDLTHGGAACLNNQCSERPEQTQDRLSALVRHLARQAARQMFSDGKDLDGPLASVDNPTPQRRD